MKASKSGLRAAILALMLSRLWPRSAMSRCRLDTSIQVELGLVRKFFDVHVSFRGRGLYSTIKLFSGESTKTIPRKGATD